jgi:hypothetical protein
MCFIKQSIRVYRLGKKLKSKAILILPVFVEDGLKEPSSTVEDRVRQDVYMNPGANP